MLKIDMSCSQAFNVTNSQTFPALTVEEDPKHTSGKNHQPLVLLKVEGGSLGLPQ